MVVALPARPSLALLGIRPDLVPMYMSNSEKTHPGNSASSGSEDATNASTPAASGSGSDASECYLLPVSMRGTVDRPQVDFLGAAQRLAAILRRQQYYLKASPPAIEPAAEGIGSDPGDATKAGSILALGKMVGKAAFRSIVIPSRETVEATEQQMAEDMARVPKRWSTG